MIKTNGFKRMMPVISHTFSLDKCSGIIVNADPNKITPVISNLISNAVKYSPKNGYIDIRCSIDGETVVVSVKN